MDLHLDCPQTKVCLAVTCTDSPFLHLWNGLFAKKSNVMMVLFLLPLPPSHPTQILCCAAASLLRDESHFSSNRILASTSPKGRRFRLEASTHRQIHRKRLSTRHRHSHVDLRCGGAVVAAVDVVVAGLLERMAKPTERVVHQAGRDFNAEEAVRFIYFFVYTVEHR